uniref:Uncharacterized protein n=1 Tax=Vitis vinifera TaxID=29760 RepID=A5ALI8_VITVI|nr:hypothetical protein VITISV_029356 [Vitis vinifera]
MNNSRLSAQSSRCFEQHKLVDDKNNLRSYELRCFPLMGSNTKSLSLMHLAMARASHLAFAIQGEFWDLDNKNLKKNISKCRSQISGSTKDHTFASENKVARFRRHTKRAAKSLRSKRLISQRCEVGFQLAVFGFQRL